MQENRSFDSYFGTFPGADGIPGMAGNPGPLPCVPDPDRKTCEPPFHDATDRNGGGPHGHGTALADIDGGQDGRLHRPGRDRPDELLQEALRRPSLLVHAGQARRDGLPRLARDPELLGVREPVRPPGPHVRVGFVVEPARAPLPRLGLVGEVHDEGRPDELPLRGAEPWVAAGRARQHDRRAARLRLDRPDVSPAQVQRQLELLRRQGNAARLRRRQDVLRAGTAEREDAGHLESAPVVRHGQAGPPAAQHRAAARSLQGPRPQPASRRSRGSSPPTRSATIRPPSSRAVRHT